MKKRSKGKAALIALIASVILLSIIIGVSLWYQSYRHVQFEPVTMICCDAVGFLVMFGLVYHFVKPTEEENQ